MRYAKLYISRPQPSFAPHCSLVNDAEQSPLQQAFAPIATELGLYFVEALEESPRSSPHGQELAPPRLLRIKLSAAFVVPGRKIDGCSYRARTRASCRTAIGRRTGR